MLEKFWINVFRLGFLGILALEIIKWRLLKSSVTFTWLGLVLTVLGVVFLIEGGAYLARKRWGVVLHWTSYAGAFLSLSLDAFGDMFHWYTKYAPWFDKALHFVAGGVIALILYDLLSQVRLKNPAAFSWGWMLVIIVLGSLLLGFSYEWLEYAEDTFYWHHGVRLGDAYDTVDDIDMTLLGGAAAALALAAFAKKPHKHG